MYGVIRLLLALVVLRDVKLPARQIERMLAQSTYLYLRTSRERFTWEYCDEA